MGQITVCGDKSGKRGSRSCTAARRLTSMTQLFAVLLRISQWACWIYAISLGWNCLSTPSPPSSLTCPERKGLNPMIIKSFKQESYSSLLSSSASCTIKSPSINPSLPPGWNFPVACLIWMMVSLSCCRKSKQAHPDTTWSLHAWGLIAKSVASALSQCWSNWHVWLKSTWVSKDKFTSLVYHAKEGVEYFLKRFHLSFHFLVWGNRVKLHFFIVLPNESLLWWGSCD